MPGTFDVCLQGQKLVVFPTSLPERTMQRERPATVDRAELNPDAARQRDAARPVTHRASRVCQGVAGLVSGAAFWATHEKEFAHAVIIGVLLALACGQMESEGAQLRAILIAACALSAIATPAVLPPDRCPLLLLVLLLAYDMYVYTFMSGKTIVSNIVFVCAFLSVAAWLFASYVMEWNSVQAAGNDVLTLAVLLALSAPNIY